jgi:hypothetical protein
MDNEDTSDRRRYELGMRVGENAIRLATNVAVGRGSPVVEVEDWEWGLALSHQAYEATVGGVRKYMVEYLHFPKFCMTLTDAYKSRKFISKTTLNRDFFQHQKTGLELDRVNGALIKQGLIREARRYPPSGGPAISGWEWVGE